MARSAETQNIINQLAAIKQANGQIPIKLLTVLSSEFLNNTNTSLVDLINNQQIVI